MKKILLSIITVTAFGFGANAQITDLPVSATPTTVCNGSSSVISTTGSQTGVSYVLRNSANTVVDGPTAGTGGNLNFNTGALTITETYNVYATEAAGANLLFDGVNDYVTLGTNARGIVGVETVSCWVKSTVSGSNQFLLSKYDGIAGILLLFDSNGKAKFDGRGYGGTYGTSGPSSTSVNDGTWHYVVGVVNNQIGSNIWKIYVDGVLENSGTAASGSGNITNSSPLHIGHHSGTYFSGEIDDVQIWSTELSASTILNNMNNCLTGTEASLFGFFKFDEGTGTSVTDLSNFGGNGVLVNMSSTSWANNSISPCGNAHLQMTQTATVSTTTKLTSLSGNTITADQTGATYKWLDCNNNNAVISGETGISYAASANGDYAVEITLNGCVDTSACINIGTIGINTFNHVDMTISPNPAKNWLNISSSETIQKVSIYSVNGALVKSICRNTNIINVSELPKGIYFLQVQTNKGMINSKFIKE